MMKVKFFIQDGKRLKNNFTVPTVIEARGEFALELALSRVIEIYYGDKIRIQLEDMLKMRLTENEIESNIKVYLNEND